MLQELEEHITTFLSRKQPQDKHILERWEARFALTQVRMYTHMKGAYNGWSLKVPPICQKFNYPMLWSKYVLKWALHSTLKKL